MIRRESLHTILACVALLGTPALGGPLNPPAGPVSPTPGPEPRTPINQANTPGDPNSVFKITQPGSYYLTSNLTGVANKHGIEIAASGVTVDLMGFSLSGVGQSLIGFTTEGPRSAITLRNGTVTGWGGAGIDLVNGGASDNTIVEGVSATFNGSAGIIAGNSAVVRGCTAKSNATVGIIAQTNASITECVASSNGTFGIEGIRAATITNCSAHLNTLIGIAADYAATITSCTANGNGGEGISTFFGGTIMGCSVYENSSHGIKATSGGSVIDCTARDNSLDGINLGSSCVARGNTCHSNGTADTIGAGVHTLSSNNRVEGNNCTNNDFGIDIDTAGNIIIRNTCADNTQNFVIVSNNVYGTIADRTTPASPPVVGDAATGTLGTTDANANFSY